MRLGARRAGGLAALLLLLATVVFGAGIGIEKAEGGEMAERPAVEQPQAENGDDASEQAAGEAHEEEILGIELESTPLVVTGVLASLLIALGLSRLPGRPMLALGGVFCLAFAVLDGVEFARKLGDETTIAVLALAALALHAGAAALAAAALRARSAGRLV